MAYVDSSEETPSVVGMHRVAGGRAGLDAMGACPRDAQTIGILPQVDMAVRLWVVLLMSVAAAAAARTQEQIDYRRFVVRLCRPKALLQTAS